MITSEYVKLIKENDKWYFLQDSKYGCYINRSLVFNTEQEGGEIRDLLNMAYKQGISDQKDAVKKVLDL